MDSRWKKLFFISLFVGGLVSLFASRSPDGLDRTAEDLGLAQSAESVFLGVMTDYVFPFVEDPLLAASLAGLAGVGFVFGVLFVLGRILFGAKSSR